MFSLANWLELYWSIWDPEDFESFPSSKNAQDLQYHIDYKGTKFHF